MIGIKDNKDKIIVTVCHSCTCYTTVKCSSKAIKPRSSLRVVERLEQKGEQTEADHHKRYHTYKALVQKYPRIALINCPGIRHYGEYLTSVVALQPSKNDFLP